jgi:hypothetical protein
MEEHRLISSVNGKIQIKTTVMGAGGVAQVVRVPPSKCQILSSNPSTAKKKGGGIILHPLNS